MDFSLELPEGMQPCQHLDFSLVRAILDLWSPGVQDNKCVMFVVICHSSNEKLTEGAMVS